MIVGFLPPAPPERTEPDPKPQGTAATLIILAVVAILILPFGWSHQTRSKWPPQKVGWSSGGGPRR